MQLVKTGWLDLNPEEKRLRISLHLIHEICVNAQGKATFCVTVYQRL